VSAGPYAQRITPRRRFRPASRAVQAELRRAAGAIEPTLFSRHESKYLIDPALVPEIRRFLRPFAVPDSYAETWPGYRYPICSLYLDSQDWMLYRQTVDGERNRFKLRVRTYSDDPAKPAFLEVKRKLNRIVHKRRAGVSREQARALVNRGRLDLGGLPRQDRRDADYFYQYVALTESRPVVRVKYKREAYVARSNEPVRVTIDTDLMHAITPDFDLRHTEGRWTSIPLKGVILEIKFTERFPCWVQELIQTFGLGQRAVPKYVWSVDHMLRNRREPARSSAGVASAALRRG